MNNPNEIGYYDDDGYEDWCENNKEYILENYIEHQLSCLDTDDLSEKERIENLTYDDVPDSYKEGLFEELLESREL
jgi:hypothetical protein